jgi:hypothetical protein
VTGFPHPDHDPSFHPALHSHQNQRYTALARHGTDTSRCATLVIHALGDMFSQPKLASKTNEREQEL